MPAGRRRETLVALLLRAPATRAAASDLPAANQRGERVQPLPPPSATAWQRLRPGTTSQPGQPGLAALRRAGRAAGRPPRAPGRGSARRCAGEAVCSCTWRARTGGRAGPAVDVDELHAPVGHDDELRGTGCRGGPAGRRPARRSPMARTCRPITHQAQPQPTTRPATGDQRPRPGRSRPTQHRRERRPAGRAGADQQQPAQRRQPRRDAAPRAHVGRVEGLHGPMHWHAHLARRAGHAVADSARA